MNRQYEAFRRIWFTQVPEWGLAGDVTLIVA